jgi:hypothetical protein
LVVREDSGFSREELMSCEAQGVDYLLGLAKNERLKAEIDNERGEAKAPYQETGRAARLFLRVRLSDAGELEPCTMGSGQGRAFWRRRKNPRGDASAWRSMAGAGVA